MRYTKNINKNPFISRAYNEFVHDDFLGTVTKKSSTNRLKNEITYYLSLPDKYKILFPRVIDYDSENRTWFTIEKYDYPDLGSIVTNRYTNGTQVQWEHVFNHIHDIIEMFRLEKTSNLKYNDCFSMYITKTEVEYKSFIQQQRWQELFKTKDMVINNKLYKSFDYIWPDVRHYIENKIIPTYSPSLIHGDLCLPNILYGSNGVLKFIDPRGSFGELVIHGDYRYDIAKLSHSVNGGYEFFNNELFTAKWDGGNNWSYNLIGSLKNKEDASAAFNNIFFTKEDKKQILIIEGLIFTGAVARHYESIDRQLALYLVGIEKFNSAMEL